MRRAAVLAALVGASLVLAAPAAAADWLPHAADATWIGTTDATWATESNWSAAPVPGTGDIATFNNSGNGNTTIYLGAGVVVGGLSFDTADAAAYSLGTDTTLTLQLDHNSNTAVGAGVGAILGKIRKSHEEKQFGVDVDEYLAPGTSAVVAVVDDKWADRVEDALDRADKRISKAIDANDYERLRKAIEESADDVIEQINS